MGIKTTFGLAAEAIRVAFGRGVSRDQINAAMGGVNNIGAVKGGRDARLAAIAKIVALQPEPSMRTMIIQHPDGRKERVAVGRAYLGGERTVVAHFDADDLVKGFATGGVVTAQDFAGLEERIFDLSAEEGTTTGRMTVAVGKDGRVGGFGLACVDEAHEEGRRIGKAVALSVGYMAVSNKDAATGPVYDVMRQTMNGKNMERFLSNGDVCKFEGETRVWTSAPLPPAKPALPVQKVWPIGMGLLGTAYKEYV